MPTSAPASPTPGAPSPPSAPPTPPRSTPGGSHLAPKQRKVVARGWLFAAIAALFAVSGLAGYLLNATSAWQDHSAQMDAANISLGTEVATLRTDLAGTQAELDVVRTQLATAQERIIQLADEKAQVGDQREYQRQLTEYQIRVTEAAGLVAAKLEECIVGQQQIISLLATMPTPDPAAPTPTATPTGPTVDELRQQVETVCQEATVANDNLQAELDK